MPDGWVRVGLIQGALYMNWIVIEVAGGGIAELLTAEASQKPGPFMVGT